MRKTAGKQRETPMRPEYDFSQGIRGKYSKRLKGGSNIVILAPELMALVRIARRRPSAK
jgi:hypothetical protein